MGRRVVLALMPTLGLLMGLAAALALPDQYGPDHSCPAGAPEVACTYPPDLLRQDLKWAAFGLVAGCFLGWIVWVFWEPQRRT